MSENLRRQRIIREISIDEVIGEYMPLQRAGAGFLAPCPFHDDQRSAFRLDPASGTFRCSECEAMGDVVDFVRMFDGLTETEALGVLEARIHP